MRYLPHICALSLALLAACCSLPSLERAPVDPAVYDNPLETYDPPAPSARTESYASFTAGFEDPRYCLPGFSVAFYDEAEGIWIDARGRVDLDFGVPWKPTTRCKIGSITKTFVSVVCLKLKEKGLLDLDLPASAWLSAAEIAGIENADKASLRQLLNHTSGIFNWSENPSWSNRVYSDKEVLIRSPSEALDLARGRRAYFAPGEGFHYSNTNYELLGLAVERATGKSLRANMEELIFAPLSLKSTDLPDLPQTPSFVPRGYNDIYGYGALTDMTERELPSNAPSGGMYSSVRDLIVFFRAIAFDRGFLSAELFEEMTRRGHKDSTIMSKYDPSFDDAECLGISTMNLKGRMWIANSGGCLGYTAYVAICLETGQGMATMVNGQNGRIGMTILRDFLMGALEKFGE